MKEINELLSTLKPTTTRLTLKHLSIVSQAMLIMTGRITMLGISRWAGKGGSYRTLQRFFHTSIPWLDINWALAKSALSNTSDAILIAGDATTVTKSGKSTYGLGRFFSSIYSRAVPGIAFQTLSLIDAGQKQSWPMLMEQIMPSPKPKKSTTQNNEQVKRPAGRPKGSKNKNHRDIELNPEQTQLLSMLQRVLNVSGQTCKPAYFVYDGALGNGDGIQIAARAGLSLVSKLRNNSALYYLWDGVYSGRGRRRIYGDKVDYQALPDEHIQCVERDGDVTTTIYQITARHKLMADTLNVVIIRKTNHKNGKQARVVLFSNDLNLQWDKLIQYYRLRFQIEFNFRDAKQHWGLEDFMVTGKQPVYNAANLSIWMVNVSQSLLKTAKKKSILDLKMHCHGMHYANSVLKLLPASTKPINIEQLLQQTTAIGQIHGDKMTA